MRHAFLVAYDGSRYFGFVRQVSKPTVEGELLKDLKDLGLYHDLKQAWYRVAARTDRGVSALGQVVALNTLAEPDLGGINSSLPGDITVLSVSPVDEKFDPRTQSLTKHYRYVCEAPEGFDAGLAKKAAKLLEGEHDFRCFCKREEGRTTHSRLSFAAVTGGEHLRFDFIGRVFLWQQVRRMVTALLDVGRGEMSLDELKVAIEGKTEHSFRPAEPEGLFLNNVMYSRLLLRPLDSAMEKFKHHLGAQHDIRSREMLGMLRHRF